MDYQDLNFKLNFPTQKAGTFSIWGTSLIDKFGSDFEKNTDKWEYMSDRSESKDKQYIAAGGISHRYFFNNDASLKPLLPVLIRNWTEEQPCLTTLWNLLPTWILTRNIPT